MTAMTRPSWAAVGGPLAPYAGGFRAELERLGYTPLTAATHVRLMAHLSRWLAREGAEASGLTPAVVEAYFAERRAAGYAGHVTGRALRPLPGYLRRLGVVRPAAPLAADAVERLLGRYREYLLVERGLAGTTADLNVRMVRPFLAGGVTAEGGGPGLGQVTAGEVAAFVVAQSRQRPKSVKRMVTALRSVLGFLHVEGLIGRPLAVPSPAGWTQAGLPRALDGDQVAALLASCDPRTRTGRRDLAILTLLARLGLRAGEVAALRLDDIDWRRGEITVRGEGEPAGPAAAASRCRPEDRGLSARWASRQRSGPDGVRPRAGPPPAADLQRRHHRGGLRGAAGRPGPDRRAPAAALSGHRHAPLRRVADRDRADAAPRPPADHRDLREGRRRGAAPAGAALAR